TAGTRPDPPVCRALPAAIPCRVCQSYNNQLCLFVICGAGGICQVELTKAPVSFREKLVKSRTKSVERRADQKQAEDQPRDPERHADNVDTCGREPDPEGGVMRQVLVDEKRLQMPMDATRRRSEEH